MKKLRGEVLITSNSMKKNECFSLSPYSNCTLLQTLSHNSIRHKSFFDIIEYINKSNIELQLRFLIKHFEH